MSSPRSRLVGLVGLLALLTLACEVSTPPAKTAPSTSPLAAGVAPPPSAAVAADPAHAPTEPAAPAEPPWDTAADLAYREVVLGGADPSTPLPMLVAIHGLGDTPDNFRHLLDGFGEPVRVILPRGLDPTDAGGWSWFPIRARDPNVEALATGIAEAARRVSLGLAQLQASRPTVGKPIVTGFSQGGMLTFTLAVHHPEVVGHAIAIGGWLPPPLVPQALDPERSYPPLHALHGTADAAVAYAPTQAAVEALAGLGLSVELTSYEGVGHMIPPPMRRDLYDRLTDAVRAERSRTP
ncbi:MAG: dienelactone hydrolase family protein [Myxococcota bacterium]